MAVTKITYTANGSQTQFTIPFEYIAEADVDVYIDTVLQLKQNTTSTAAADHPQVISGEITQGTALINYTFANATTIQFNSAPANGAFVFIERTTDDTSIVTFTSGSTIRASELNTALEQVRFIAQEGTNTAQEGIVPSKNNAASIDAQGKRLENLADANSDDDAVTRAQLGKVITDDLVAGNAITLTDATGGTNSNKQVTVAVTNGEIDTAELADNAVTTAKITDSNVTTAKIADQNVTTAKIADSAVTSAKIADGTIVNADINASANIAGSKLADNSVDLDKIVDADIVETSGYSSNWASDDTKIATVGSLAARHDLVVNTDVNPPSTAQTGKQWLSTAPGNQVHKIYDGSGWRTVAVGQPFSPATTTVVRYVDVTNGSDASDVTGFLPQAPLQSIGRALELINASSSGDGSLIKVAPGVYQETLPLRIKKNNISIVGESMRSCFVHPTVATENNDMFEVDSGSYIANLTLLGLKVPTANQGSRNNSLDNDATYGLPSNQPFSVRFRTDTQPTILKSPYIQNCTHFSDAHFDNANFDPNTFPSTDSQTYSAVAGDESSAPCGGGLLVDGSAVSSSSPIRSMVVDAFTQITLDGPGILVTNNGYAQLVSFFGTFAHYHAKAKNGGQINLSNCVSDFGRYGLIADGKSPSAIATATASAANSGATTITIGAITTAGSFHGTVSRPLDHMMVTIDGVDYGVVSSTANGSGWDIVLTSGLTSNITNTTVSFALRSYISTGGHTFEFVGVGTDYGDHPDNGGVPVEANQVIELNGGKVWQSSTDHVGKFKAGNVLVVNQVAETVDLKATTVTGNLAVTGTVDGRDVATDGTKLDGIETGATADQTAAEIRTLVESASDSNVFTDADHTKLNGIATGATAYANSDVDTHLNQSTAASGEVLSWNGSDYDWVAQSSGGGGTMSNVVEDTTPQLGGNLDVNGQDIVSVSNGDIDLDPNGSGVVVFKGNSTKGSGQFKLNCENNSHGITIKGPPHSAAASYTLTLPNTDGNANEVLKTDGSGNLSWVVAGGASEVDDLSDALTANSGNTLGIGTGALANDDGNGSGSVALGYNALNSPTTSSRNTAVGWGALQNAHNTSYDHTAVGYKALYAGGGASQSTAVGKSALESATSNNNVAVGHEAGRNITTGSGNTVMGKSATDTLTTGANNVHIGMYAGQYATTSQTCSFIGTEAGRYTTTGNQNTAVGHEALRNNTTGYQNTAVGQRAAKASTGYQNTAIGKDSLFSSTGNANTCLGYYSGSSVGSGSNNIVIGHNADVSASNVSNEITLGSSSITSFRIPGLQSGATNGQVLTYNSSSGNITLADAGGGLSNNATTGSDNFGVGTNALDSNTASGAQQNTAFGIDTLTALNSASADYNTAVGYGAGRALTTASDCTFLGANTGEGTTTGIKNVYLGSYAGGNKTTASNNVIIGYAAGSYNSSGDGQVFVGHEAGKYATGTGCVAVGFNALDASGCTGPDNTAVGYEALSLVTTGEDNTAIGSNALKSITTNDACTAVGSNALQYQTGGSATGVGYNAGIFQTTGGHTTYVGWYSGFGTAGSATASFNTYVGSMSGFSASTGGYNVGMGYQTLYSNTTGQYNVGIGHSTLRSNTTATGNTAVGYVALYSTTTGDANTAVGYQCLEDCTTGANNTGLGYRVLEDLTTGGYNTCIGMYAGTEIQTGGGNTALGQSSLYVNTTSNYNTSIGYNAHYALTYRYNTALGAFAADDLETGENTIVIGYNAQASSVSASNEITLGNSNVNKLRLPGMQSSSADGHVLTYNHSNGYISLAAAGGGGVSDASTLTLSTGLSGDGTALDAEQSGAGTYGNGNTAVGAGALTDLTTGYDNVAVGTYAGFELTTGQNCVYIGNQAGENNTTGRHQTFVGRRAGMQQAGNENVAVGYDAMKGSPSSSTGIYNVAVGVRAGFSNTAGQDNTFVGYNSGEDLTTATYTTLVGTHAGYDITTGTHNTCIGSYAGYNITTGANNACLGKNAETSSSTASGEFVLGDTSISTLRCNTSTISSLSDGRDKTEVEDLPLGLDFIDTLRPVKFKWDTRDGNIKDGSYDAGFIAQDLQSAQSTSDAEYLNMVMDNNPDRLEARYGQLIPVLVQAIKDLKFEIETLKSNA